jgi:hypothetical protein
MVRWRWAVCAAALCALAAAPAVKASSPFAAPSAGESLAPGSIVEVHWTSLCDDLRHRDLDEAEIVLSLDGGRTFPIRVSPELSSSSTRFLWTVPSLPAAHARLAIRAGDDERDATETLEIVSADFRILPDPDGRVEQLRRRAAEWWTPSATPVATAEDLLEHSMSPAHPLVVTPFALPEASMAPEGPGSVRPEPAASAAMSIPYASPARQRPTTSRTAGASTPLRL